MANKIFSLEIRDVVKGLAVVVLTAVLTLVLQLVNDKGLGLTGSDVQTVAQVAITSGIGYLLKNWLTDKNDKILGKI